MNSFDVIVIGAGPAGSATAIHLTSRGYEVLLLEKHFYPTHKLCGEFLSGESRRNLLGLGLLEAVSEAGARPVTQMLFSAADGSRFSWRLPTPGFGISRYTFDHLLMIRAVAAGVTVRQGLSAKSIEGSLRAGFEVRTETESFTSRVVVGAFGKRSLLDRKLERAFLHEARPIVAFKAHFASADPDGQVELHAFDGGYCGICPAGPDAINACWLSSDEKLRRAGGDPDRLLQVIMAENGLIGARLEGLERISSSYLATGQIHVRRKLPHEREVLMVGDAAGMIAPMCGEGMSMALRSAEMVVPLIDRHLRGRLSGEGLLKAYGRRWALEFRARMYVGYWLHQGFGNPRAALIGLRTVKTLPGLANLLFRSTRS